MKKYAKDEYKYSDLVKKAESDADCARYLSWIVSTYGSDLTKKVVKSVPETPSGDLACYLQRIQWEPPRTGRTPLSNIWISSERPCSERWTLRIDFHRGRENSMHQGNLALHVFDVGWISVPH